MECPHTLENFSGKSVLCIDCRKCINNGTLTNSKCRKRIFSLLSEEPADMLILKKDFQRIYENIFHLQAYFSLVNSFKLCKKCSEIFKDKFDPIDFYFSLTTLECKECEKLIEQYKRNLNSLFIIRLSSLGKEKAYSRYFHPKLFPNLISSFIETKPPKNFIDSYKISDVNIYISKTSRPDNLYFVDYPEVKLSYEENKFISKTFNEICDKDFSGNIKNEITKIIKEKCNPSLSEILLRHTIGFNLLDPILKDEKIQDVFVDSKSQMVHVIHSEHGECITNIFMSSEDIEKIATRLRYISSRPLDTANPVLHTEVNGIRVCSICEPSTYKGLGFSFRRRKTEPWTLCEFVKNKMMDLETAGLLSFLADSNCSILITGPRGSGKTSLLSSLLLEIPQNNRFIIIEDTPEIPVSDFQKLGFKIEHLKTEAFAKGFEISTEDALRTSLRLGDSTLVIGEVRGPEAKALFEAMRIGAAGNTVLGTIHGSCPYDTWDRVTNDLGVPSTCFKAVDVILTAGTIRLGDTTKKYRRLLEVSEVKDYTDSPKFSNILTLKNSKLLEKLAKSKSLTMQQLKKSIKIRTEMKKHLIDKNKTSAKWTVVSNNKFLKLVENNNHDEAFRGWLNWLKISDRPQ